jgi:hypothetical protein
MDCPELQLSTLMCVIPASKGSLVRMQGGGSAIKFSMESRKKHSALSGGCWKVWNMFNFTFRFPNLIFIIPVLQFMFALVVAKKRVTEDYRDHLCGISHKFSIKNNEVHGEIEIVDLDNNILDDSPQFLDGLISQLQDNWCGLQFPQTQL